MPTIDNLVLEIESNSADAERGLDNVAKALDRLRTFSSNQRGLNVVAKGLRSIADATNAINMTGVQSLNEMTNALVRMGALNNVKLSSSFASQIKAIGDASKALSGVDFSPVSNLATALAPLSGIGKATNLNNVVNTLRKLPDAINNVNNIDSAKIEEFARKVEQLRAAIHPLADEMRAVSAGFSALPKNIQKAINANAKLTSSNEKTSRSFSALIRKLFKYGTAYYAIRHAFNYAMDAFKKNNEYVEALNLAEITLGKNAEAAKAYAEQVERLAGINQVEWLTNVGTMNQIFTGFGVGADKAAHMSQQLTQLAYDIQSAYNVTDLSEIMRRLQSGITGEVEGMRRYGVELSNASMQEYLHAQGINAKVSSLNMAEKSMVRYAMIMEKTSNIQGDLARTIATPANALRILSSQIAIAGRYFGQLVSIIATAVIPIMQAVVKVIAMAAQALAALFGYTLPSIGGGGGGGDIARGIGGVSDAIGGVGGSAKEAKKEVDGLLASFDEINVIQQESASGGGGGGGAGGAGGVGNLDFLADYEYDFLAGLKEDENSLFNRLIELAKSGKWNELGYEIERAINGAINKIDASAIGARLGKVVTGAVDFALGFLRNAASGIWDIGQKIGELIQGAIVNTDWASVFTLIGIVFAIKFAGLPFLLMAVFSEIEWGVAAQELINGVLSGITGALSWLFASLTQAIQQEDWESIGSKIAESIFSLDFSAFVEDMNLSGLIDTIGTFLNTLYETVTSLSGEAWLGLTTFVAIGGALLGVFTGNWIPLIVGAIALVGPKIIEGIGAAITWWNETAKPAISNWWEGIKLAWEGFGLWVQTTFIAPISEWFSGLGTEIGTAMQNAVTGLKTAWEGIGTWFTDTVCTPVVTFFTDMVNSIIDAINAVIGFLNGLAVTIPSVTIPVPSWAQNLFGWGDLTIGGGTIDFFNIPTIPRFAEGGFPEMGQLFIANEAGPELIGQMGNRTAVANSEQIVQGVSSGVAQANMSLEQKVERLIMVTEAILQKEFTAEVRPSAALGKTVKRSMEMQARVSG